MSEAQGDAHGAEHGKEEHKSSSLDGLLNEITLPAIVGTSVAGVSYLVMASAVATSVFLGVGAGLGYMGISAVYNWYKGKSSDNNSTNAEPAHAGAGGHH